MARPAKVHSRWLALSNRERSGPRPRVQGSHPASAFQQAPTLEKAPESPKSPGFRRQLQLLSAMRQDFPVGSWLKAGDSRLFASSNRERKGPPPRVKGSRAASGFGKASAWEEPPGFPKSPRFQRQLRPAWSPLAESSSRRQDSPLASWPSAGHSKQFVSSNREERGRSS